MEKQWIGVEKVNKRLSVVTLKRKEKRNALNLKLLEELCDAVDDLPHTGCSCAIIRAEGSAFCAGLDLKEAVDPLLEEATASHVARLLSTLYYTPLVTIAAVQGDALAGGAGLVMVCDLAVMAKKARIGFPEVRRGLVAALVGAVLTQRLSGSFVRELLLTGEPVDAEKALGMGLAGRLVNDDKVLEEALSLAHSVLRGGPEALKLTKKLIQDLEPGEFSKNLQHALAFHHAVRQSAEAKEGIEAFLEKRKPNWC